MEGGLPVAPRNAPRCNLKGHGVFKGAGWRMEGRRRGCKGGDGDGLVGQCGTRWVEGSGCGLYGVEVVQSMMWLEVGSAVLAR